MIKQSSQGIKAASSEHSAIISIFRGILLSYFITIPMFIVFAFILTYADFPEGLVSPAVILITIISAAYAGYSSAKDLKKMGWLNGGAAGLIYMIILYLTSSIMSGKYNLDLQALMTVLIGVLSGAVGGITGINVKKSGKHRGKN